MFAVPLLLSAAAAQASATTGTLIQCPDWQRYAPPVVPTVAGDGQTRTAFTERTRPRSQASATPASAKASTCRHTIRPGDTLGTIAAAKLGSSTRWREIAAVNPGLAPTRLPVGSTINLPCGASGGDRRVAAVGVTPLAGTRWLARVFGVQTQPGTATPANLGTSAPSAPDLTPPVAETEATALPEPELPVWSAGQGEYLSDILERWGREAGWRVIVDTNDAWQLAVPLRFRASFEDAVGELVRGLAHGGTPPRVRLHPNKVLRLGGPL